MKKIYISVIIPVKNEEKSIPILYKELKKILQNIKKSFEIIFIDDGSTDLTFSTITKIHRKEKRVKVTQLRGNWGKSTALKIGFTQARGDIIFTLDGDLQDDPKEIPNFLKKINEGYDLVTGWKKKRHDSLHTVFFSRILNNFLIPTFSGVKVHDTNCGFKAYKKEVAKSLDLYGELYRYIPIIVAKNNFKIAEIEINHRARKFGRSKYGITKNVKGLLDLITIVFLTKYLKRPGHFFGTGGLISFFFGFLIGLYIAYLRITTGTIQNHQPLLNLGVILIMVGVQLITTGLLAEMITYTNQQKGESKNQILRILD